ncbi:MAG: TerC family protein [Mycobacteriaceae bacterium]|nr:TerC family protein [Mycobacteriaceae bacterium]
MSVPGWLWIFTLLGFAGWFALELAVGGRRPHEVRTREAVGWVAFSVLAAIVFGTGVWVVAGHDYGVQFFTGYLTEYSLSMDNLFVFMVILSAFAVPTIYQSRVLLIGIALALLMRGVFIAVGAALVAKFVWVFFFFGAILLWTAMKVARGEDETEEYHENALVRRLRARFPITDEFQGTKLTVRADGRRFATPLLLVVVAVGSADLLFAVDSIPAIFGITQEPFLVFTANAFALMGLRQLYFLLGKLADKLIYLSYGLAVILAFIGVKLMLHAVHEYDKGPDWLEINNWVSLAVIVAVLAITTVASLVATRRSPNGIPPTPDTVSP